MEFDLRLEIWSLHIGTRLKNFSDSMEMTFLPHTRTRPNLKVRYQKFEKLTKIFLKMGSITVESKFQKKTKRFLKIGFKLLKNRSKIACF